MASYIKLICIDCDLEQIVEIPPDGGLKCPKCGNFAQIPVQRPVLNVAVEEIVGLHGKAVFNDIERFCSLLVDTLAKKVNLLHYYRELNWIYDLQTNTQNYPNFSVATQADYTGCTNPLIDAIFEAVGVETISKKQRGLAYVPPKPTLPHVPNNFIANDFVVDVTHSNKMVKSQTSKPTPTPTPVVKAKSYTLNRFVLPKGNSATINCVLDASISGWDKGNYIVRFRTGYPCCDGENPKDAVLEICRFGTSGSTTIKTGYLNNTRRISASTRIFSASDLMIEFSDGTDAFLVSVPRRERKGLDKLLEIARYNNRT